MAKAFTRRARQLFAAGALIGLTIAVPTTAGATPHSAPHQEPTVTSVQKQLGALALQNSQLVEKYNQSQIAVQKRAKLATAAAGAARSAERAYEVRRTQFVQTIQAQYEGTNTSFGATSALLDSDSGTNYLDRLATLDMISSNTAQMVKDVRQARTDASAASDRADQMLTSAKADRKALGKKKSDVQKQIDKYRVLLDRLSAQARAAFNNRNAAPKADTTPKHLQHLTVAGTGAARAAVKYALAQVGKAYVFGASGPGAFDCSGLTMAAWKRGGVNLPHSAEGQYGYGHHIANRSDLQPGDLIFYYSPIGHVTIYIGDGMMVSASTESRPVEIESVSRNAGDITGMTRLTS